MAFDRSFLKLMDAVVTVAPFISYDRGNQPTYGPAVEFHARVSGKLVSLRRSEKQDWASIMDVWLGPRVDGGDEPVKITLQDQLILPDEPVWVDRYPVIFAIGRYTDDTAHHHAKLQCGSMYHRQGQ
jgi:hypothetical protein